MEAQLIFKTTPWSRSQCYPHFTDGKSLVMLSNLPKVMHLAGGRVGKSNSGHLPLASYDQALQNTALVNLGSFPLFRDSVNFSWDLIEIGPSPRSRGVSRRLPGQLEMERNEEPEKWEIGICGNVCLCVCMCIATICFGLSQWLIDPGGFLGMVSRH